MESTIYTVDGKSFELQHYGVKGMKWGVRKAQNEYAKLDKLKGEYKKAKKAYNKAYNRASGFRNYGSFSPIKAHRDASQKRWEKAYDKSRALADAKKAYKDQKKEVRKNTTIGQKIGRGAKRVSGILATVGGMYLSDQVFNGGEGTKAVKATVKVGTKAVENAMNKVADQKFDYALLDKSGRVIKRYN